jgi:hypothetical protein
LKRHCFSGPGSPGYKAVTVGHARDQEEFFVGFADEEIAVDIDHSGLFSCKYIKKS